MNFMLLPSERSVSVTILSWRISSLSLGFHPSTNFVLSNGTSEVSVFPLQRPRIVIGLDTIYFWVNLMDSLTEVLRQLWLGYHRWPPVSDKI